MANDHIRVHVVTTTNIGSMDSYGRELARRLPVPTVQVDTRGASMDTFGAPLLSGTALRGVARDLQIVRTLRQVTGVLHFTHHHMARYGPLADLPYLVTAHDVIRWWDLQGGPPLISTPNARDRLGLRRDYAAFGRAIALIAVSDATKADLVAHLGLPEERIHVVPEGVDLERFRPRGRRPIPERYVLYVGSEHPRKNLRVLLEAMALLKSDPSAPRLRLLKVGRPGGGEAPFRSHTLADVERFRLQDDIVFTEHVPDEVLPAYYTHAEALVLPSLYEGFGFPAVEAMACGCPVVVSSAGSLPEVTGGAALVVDPSDAPALARTLREVWTTPRLGEELRQAGLRRASVLGWDSVAEQTMAVYERVLRDRRPASPRGRDVVGA